MHLKPAKEGSKGCSDIRLLRLPANEERGTAAARGEDLRAAAVAEGMDQNACGGGGPAATELARRSSVFGLGSESARGEQWCAGQIWDVFRVDECTFADVPQPPQTVEPSRAS